MSPLHRGPDAAKHLDSDDPTEPILLAFSADPDAPPRSGRLLSFSSDGCVLSIDGVAVSFDREGWSDDRALCLDIETNPAQAGAEGSFLALLRSLVPNADTATHELLAAHAAGDTSADLRERLQERLQAVAPATLVEGAGSGVIASGWAILATLASIAGDAAMLSRIEEWAVEDLLLNRDGAPS